MSHINNGKCPQCELIINKYHGFNEELESWFWEMQARHPEMHTSCAGRGRNEQEQDFHKGVSRAHYGHSAHNYNCALDLFVIQHGLNLYDRKWFDDILAPNIPGWLNWYGAPGAPYPELPHVEMRFWRHMIDVSLARLVE